MLHAVVAAVQLLQENTVLLHKCESNCCIYKIEALHEVGPEMPERDQKSQRCQSSEQIWNFFGSIQLISCRDW
jgi:hypothetical protein